VAHCQLLGTLAYRGMFHASVPTSVAQKGYSVEDMASSDAPKTIGEVLDFVERIREELLTLQRSLDKMERATASVSGDGTKKR